MPFLKYRDQWAAEGLCNRCGKEQPIDGLKYGPACKARAYADSQRRYNADPERAADSGRERRLRLRYEVLNRYSGRCACCGISDPEFLTIDHIGGGGNEHRREIGSKGGPHFYRWLKRQGFPDGYRVMCWNCNAATSYGICPHQRLRRAKG